VKKYAGRYAKLRAIADDKNADDGDRLMARLKMAEEEAKAQPELTQRVIEIAQANLDASNAQLKVQQDSLKLMLESTHPQALVNAQSTYVHQWNLSVQRQVGQNWLLSGSYLGNFSILL
jgi:hypothetical protein